jgi:hypothetical protein
MPGARWPLTEPLPANGAEPAPGAAHAANGAANGTAPPTKPVKVHSAASEQDLITLRNILAAAQAAQAKYAVFTQEQVGWGQLQRPACRRGLAWHGGRHRPRRHRPQHPGHRLPLPHPHRWTRFSWRQRWRPTRRACRLPRWRWRRRAWGSLRTRWGRAGRDEDRGRLNLITPPARPDSGSCCLQDAARAALEPPAWSCCPPAETWRRSRLPPASLRACRSPRTISPPSLCATSTASRRRAT